MKCTEVLDVTFIWAKNGENMKWIIDFWTWTETFATNLVEFC